MYILTKFKPPMDVDFMISDTFELLRPKMRIFSTYEEANEAVDQILLEQLKSVQGNLSNKLIYTYNLPNLNNRNRWQSPRRWF